MKTSLTLKGIAVCILAAAAAGCSPKSEMDRFVDGLLSKMTVEEKIGQLNLVSGMGFRSDLSNNTSGSDMDLLRQGGFGAFYGIKDLEQMTELQRIAVEETRLGIPLMFRRHPRTRDHLPHTPRAGVVVGHGPHRGKRDDFSERGKRTRSQLGVQPHGGHSQGPQVGPRG